MKNNQRSGSLGEYLYDVYYVSNRQKGKNKQMECFLEFKMIGFLIG